MMPRTKEVFMRNLCDEAWGAGGRGYVEVTAVTGDDHGQRECEILLG